MATINEVSAVINELNKNMNERFDQLETNTTALL